jgi:hypothetical protein
LPLFGRELAVLTREDFGLCRELLWECTLLTDAVSVSESGEGGMGWVSAVPISSVEGSPENKQIGQGE